MNNLTAEVVAILCGARCSGTLPAGEFSSVTTDSRQVEEGSLFAAIVGERVDGHNFLDSAKEKGAVCALVEREVDCDLPQLIVPSTQASLQALAAYYRSQFSIPVIGITGSVGKTTAKEMISSVLSQKFNTLKTEKNFNNELGVPFTLFRLRDEHEAAVVEMGISDFGEMTRLSAMVKPDIAVFTLIGDAHLEFLHSREGVLKAKSEILCGMKSDGIVIANGDDVLLKNHDFNRKTLLFGLGKNSDVRADNVKMLGGESISCDIRYMDRVIHAQIPSYGEHMIYAALMGAAVGIALGLSDMQIEDGIGSFENVGHRNRVLHVNGLTVIDDCYNSNPTSAAAAVRSMDAFEGRKVCVLGDMLELGKNSATLHRDLGALAGESCDLVLACGELSRSIAEGAGRKGHWFETAASLIPQLSEYIQTGDVILVKASRRMKFEEISAALCVEK